MDQDQERGLKRILGVGRIGEDVAADAEHHRTVTLDQRGERRLGRRAAAGCEPFQ